MFCAGWWSDYAEHATLALAGVLAASRGPGWRVLRVCVAQCGSTWDWSPHSALPHHPGSWGRIGGTAAISVGAGFGVAAWLERERDVPATVD